MIALSAFQQLRPTLFVLLRVFGHPFSIFGHTKAYFNKATCQTQGKKGHTVLLKKNAFDLFAT